MEARITDEVTQEIESQQFKKKMAATVGFVKVDEEAESDGDVLN